MAPGRRWIVLVCTCFAALLLAGLMHVRTRPRLTEVTLDGKAVALPYAAPAANERVMEFSLHLQGVAPTQSFVIVPDDEVKAIAVNGVDESLSGVDPKGLS